MRPYYIHEANLMLPAEWQDQSLNVFSVPAAEGGKHVSFVVSRDHETRCATASEYADKQIVEGARKLAQYQIVRRATTTVCGQPAMEIDFTWVAPTRDEIRQRQSFVRYGESFLIFTLSAPSAGFDAHAEVWPRLMENVQLRF